jgi:Domain of unknown function (DUF1127)
MGASLPPRQVLEVQIMSNQHRGSRPLSALLAGLAHLAYSTLIGPLRRPGEQELARVDDRVLRDIGLTRSQIHGAACGLIRLGERPVQRPEEALHLAGRRPGAARG